MLAPVQDYPVTPRSACRPLLSVDSGVRADGRKARKSTRNSSKRDMKVSRRFAMVQLLAVSVPFIISAAPGAQERAPIAE